MSNAFWKEGFGSLLPNTDSFRTATQKNWSGNCHKEASPHSCSSRSRAEGGVWCRRTDTCSKFRHCASRYQTLFVLDEVQTGLYQDRSIPRCPPLWCRAGHGRFWPKRSAAGLIPCSAVLMTDAVYDSVYSSLKRALIHTSTFSENSLAMRAGLASLDILEDERLGERAIIAGENFRGALTERLAQYEMVGEICGLGLLNAIEFKAPYSFTRRLAFETFAKIHPAIFGQIVVMRLFRDHGILCQVCGNDFMVLKISPPLVVSDAQIDRFVSAVEQVVQLMHRSSSSFWSEALGIAQRVVKSI